MSHALRIAVGEDITGWFKHFAEALEAKRLKGYPVEYSVVSLEGHDWLDVVEPFDAVIWKPAYMGPNSAAQFQAKVYFLENFAGKIVVPSFRTIWHFENKISQSYIFRALGVPSPRTIATFDYHDARKVIASEDFPLVFKESFGAGSANVRLVKDLPEAESILEDIFSQQIWYEGKMRLGSSLRLLRHGIFKKWYWAKIRRKLKGHEDFRSAYWQEFVPGQKGDIRITVIGDRHAYVYRRGNRPNDFRASGSGRLDYETPVSEDIIRYCIHLNRQLGVDSMAYDILIKNEQMVITEMSYGYIDRYLYECPGIHLLRDDGTLDFEKGHIRPQSLWVAWALRRIEEQGNRNPRCSESTADQA